MTDDDCDLRPHAPECVRRGHRKLAPGIYRCVEGHDHMILPEICRAAGVPVTRENCERLAKAAVEWLEQHGAEARIVE